MPTTKLSAGAGGTKKKRIFTTTPVFPQMPGAPGVKGKRGAVHKGVELRPLKGPGIKLPGDQDEQTLERWNVWRAKYNGSLPEFIVWEWLVFKKRQVPFVDFVFQYPVFGGRTIFGGFILDYYFPLRGIAWFIQGLRFHYVVAQDRARDFIAKTMISGRGLTVVELFEDDILDRPEYTLSLAWNGSQVGGRERL